MCTNRALTDLYAFSARFIQLLNRKLAYAVSYTHLRAHET